MYVCVGLGLPARPAGSGTLRALRGEPARSDRLTCGCQSVLLISGDAGAIAQPKGAHHSRRLRASRFGFGPEMHPGQRAQRQQRGRNGYASDVDCDSPAARGRVLTQRTRSQLPAACACTAGRWRAARFRSERRRVRVSACPRAAGTLRALRGESARSVRLACGCQSVRLISTDPGAIAQPKGAHHSRRPRAWRFVFGPDGPCVQTGKKYIL